MKIEAKRSIHELYDLCSRAPLDLCLQCARAPVLLGSGTAPQPSAFVGLLTCGTQGCTASQCLRTLASGATNCVESNSTGDMQPFAFLVFFFSIIAGISLGRMCGGPESALNSCAGLCFVWIPFQAEWGYTRLIGLFFVVLALYCAIGAAC